jgi:hypothetical protein
MKEELHKGNIGTIFRATIKEAGSAKDISSATLMQYTVRPPSGALRSWGCAFTTDGSNGQMEYALVAGDLNVAGRWQLQGSLVSPSWTLHTDVIKFTVEDNLFPP